MRYFYNKKGFTLAEVFTPHSGGQRKTGFTLAEVLITLGIIGVVAAMTLPALFQNNRNKELASGLNAAYSILQQGLQKMQAEQGFPPVPEDYSVNGSFYPQYAAHFSKIYDCTMYNPDESVCMSRANTQGDTSESAYYNDPTYKTYNGKMKLFTGVFDDGQFVLPNGMLVSIENQFELFISVDVNGKKKGPNRLGQDMFMFQLMSDGKLLPMGAPNTAYADSAAYCSAASTNNLNGAACTYYALTEKDFFLNMPK